MKSRLIGFLFLALVAIGVFAAVKDRFSIFFAALGFVFVFQLFGMVFKVKNFWLRLILPLWVMEYMLFRNFRTKSRKKVFKAVMFGIIYAQPLLVYAARIYFPESEIAFYQVGYWTGYIMLPWVFEKGKVVYESVGIFVLSMNFVGMLFMNIIMAVKNLSGELSEALLRYPQFKSARRLAVKRLSLEMYLMDSDAAVSHEFLIDRQEEIGGVIGTPVVGVNKAGANKYEFHVGALDAKRDERGRYISKVKWEGLEFIPQYRTSLFGLFKKFNPASRTMIPTGMAGGRTTYMNLLQTAHFGKIGNNNSGKTSSVVSLAASAVVVDPQSLFVFIDIVKGVDYTLLEIDPALLFSDKRPKGMSLLDWGRQLPRLANVFVVREEMALVGFIRFMKNEIARRKKILMQYPSASSLYDLEFAGSPVAIKNIADPQRVARLFIIVDDYLILKEKANETIANALREIEDWVSIVRFLKIHIGFLSQKGTVKVLDNARDQLDWEAYGTPASVSEYILKSKVAVPPGIGIFGYTSAETGRVGIACSPYIKKVRAAEILALAEKQLFPYNFALGQMIKAGSGAEGDFETMEGISVDQTRLLNIPIAQ